MSLGGIQPWSWSSSGAVQVKNEHELDDSKAECLSDTGYERQGEPEHLSGVK